MDHKLADKSCREFTEALASKVPVPGGGGVAALLGALGSALCSMVGNYTLGRKKYAQYEDDIHGILQKTAVLREELLCLIDKDAQAFEPLSRAYSIPKDNPDRNAVIQQKSLDACQAPLEMMRYICKVIDLLEEMHTKGTVTLESDIGCGAFCCRAALECASVNVFINTKTLPCEIVKHMEQEANLMLETYVPKAEMIGQLTIQNLKRREETTID